MQFNCRSKCNAKKSGQFVLQYAYTLKQGGHSMDPEADASELVGLCAAPWTPDAYTLL
jgi:hypothetical protein